MVQEEEYRFDEAGKPEKKSKMKAFLNFLWNSETKEFCGRDGASWGKVSLFYAVFYACLGSFFVGMLAVFMSIMPKDRPTYYGESSTMNIRKINPGLGFRPQVDVEDHLILFAPTVLENDKNGFKPFVNNLNNFLDKKYPAGQQDAIDCVSGSDYQAQLREGKSCKFDYESIFAGTPCNRSNNYGFGSHSPCILLKLNKNIDWVPQIDNNGDSVVVRCEGETAVDRDNIKKATYYSEGHLGDVEGKLNKKYFPFFAQKGYRAPFVFAQFDVTPNVLVNIECRAYAANIENDDRLNKRGMTKFSLFVVSKV